LLDLLIGQITPNGRTVSEVILASGRIGSFKRAICADFTKSRVFDVIYALSAPSTAEFLLCGGNFVFWEVCETRRKARQAVTPARVPGRGFDARA
jgi:hypothetical protein